MSLTSTEALFVHGVEKTGTSTLVGILNSHPEIFVLYETRIDRSRISKYGNQLLEHLPQARTLFRKTSDITKPYLKLSRLLRDHNPELSYRYIGDKVISLDPGDTQPDSPHKTIYAIRDARTWLCKDQIVRYYRTDLDLVAPAVDYLRYIINSYRYPDSMHVRLADLVLQNDDLLVLLSDFLDLDLLPTARSWWKKIGSYGEDDPKSYLRWFESHGSSRVKPNALDTTVEIQPHPFWEEYLPVFDRYYQRGSRDIVPQAEIESDLVQLASLLKHAPLPLEKCYQVVETQRLSSREGLAARIKKRVSAIWN